MAAQISPRLCNSSKPYNIVIVGGSYAGLSASLALIALKDGQTIPFAAYGNYSHLRAAPRVQDLRITIIDQRDGFCMVPFQVLDSSKPVLLTDDD